MATKKSTAKPKSILAVGEQVIVRTVTLHYTGRVVSIDAQWLHLDDAAWIADTGRWAEALKTGRLSEVEPYPGPCAVAVGSVVDVSPWNFALPRAVL